MRDFKKSRFIKVVGVTEEDDHYIVKTKKKKSIAGRLEEIINKNKRV